MFDKWVEYYFKLEYIIVFFGGVVKMIGYWNGWGRSLFCEL